MTDWTLTIQTERLILRPQQESDYESWYTGFDRRLPSQHQYDEGWVSLEKCDRVWFRNLCARHQREALNDQFYIFGVFDRQNRHLGNIDFTTLQRGEYQWAILGYSIHNQYWRQGFGKEAVKAALVAGFESLQYHRIEAVINLDNWTSLKLAESVGMQKECMRR